MRQTVLTVAACVLLLAFAPRAFSATEEWRFPLPQGNQLRQLVTDDVGGVAFAYDLGSQTYIVWLDSRGRQIYQKQMVSGVTPSPILGVNSRALVIVDSDQAEVVVVERNATKLNLPNFGIVATNVGDKHTDLNGFCVVAIDPSTSESTAVVRFRY